MAFDTEYGELTMDDLHYDDLDQQLSEMDEEEVVESGTYDAAATGYQLYTDNEREMAAINYTLYNEAGQGVKTVKLRVSWQRMLSPNGRADKPFRLYRALTKALGGERIPTEVLPLSEEVPVRLSVNEAYKVPESGAHESHKSRQVNDEGEIWAIINRSRSEDERLKNQEVRRHYLSQGLDPILLVQGVFAQDD